MVRLAFKRSKASGLLGRAIDLLSGNKGFCHVELVFSDGRSFSSTTLDPDGGDKGCRFKQISYSHPADWFFVDLPRITAAQEEKMRAKAKELDKKPYDKHGVARFVLPFMKEHPEAYFCSEVVVTVLQAGGYLLGILPWKVSPNKLLWYICGGIPNYLVEE